VAAEMAGWTGCDTRNLYAAAAEVQSANSAAGFRRAGGGKFRASKSFDGPAGKAVNSVPLLCPSNLEESHHE